MENEKKEIPFLSSGKNPFLIYFSTFLIIMNSIATPTRWLYYSNKEEVYHNFRDLLNVYTGSLFLNIKSVYFFIFAALVIFLATARYILVSINKITSDTIEEKQAEQKETFKAFAKKYLPKTNLLSSFFLHGIIFLFILYHFLLRHFYKLQTIEVFSVYNMVLYFSLVAFLLLLLFYKNHQIEKENPGNEVREKILKVDMYHLLIYGILVTFIFALLSLFCYSFITNIFESFNTKITTDYNQLYTLAEQLKPGSGCMDMVTQSINYYKINLAPLGYSPLAGYIQVPFWAFYASVMLTGFVVMLPHFKRISITNIFQIALLLNVNIMLVEITSNLITKPPIVLQSIVIKLFAVILISYGEYKVFLSSEKKKHTSPPEEKTGGTNV